MAVCEGVTQGCMQKSLVTEAHNMLSHIHDNSIYALLGL